jgi:uncharacterized protein YbbK (DUF523 family)
MTKILVSACLLGQKVRYDGEDNLVHHAKLQQWIKDDKVIAFCPEVAGGLPTPRPPAEIEPGKTAERVLQHHAKIITIEGEDVTNEFMKGAEKTLALCQQHHIKVTILKARSPSCGSRQIYDGSHTDKIIDGMGVTAALLTQNGIEVFNEDTIDLALEKAGQYQ